MGFLLSDFITSGTLRLVSRHHLIELDSAAHAGDHRTRTRKFRELNTTLFVASWLVGVLLYFLPIPLLEDFLGLPSGVARAAAEFCRVAVLAVIPRIVTLVLAEVVLTPQLGGVPVSALGMYVRGLCECVRARAYVVVVRAVRTPLRFQSAQLNWVDFPHNSLTHYFSDSRTHSLPLPHSHSPSHNTHAWAGTPRAYWWPCSLLVWCTLPWSVHPLELAPLRCCSSSPTCRLPWYVRVHVHCVCVRAPARRLIDNQPDQPMSCRICVAARYQPPTHPPMNTSWVGWTSDRLADCFPRLVPQNPRSLFIIILGWLVGWTMD